MAAMIPKAGGLRPPAAALSSTSDAAIWLKKDRLLSLCG